MESLASILAGGGANPYQQPQGLAPLLSQLLLAQQMAPGQLGQGQPQPGGPMPGAVGGAPQAQGLGGMGAAAQMPQGMPGAAALPFLLGG
jgi:hypothetical protein